MKSTAWILAALVFAMPARAATVDLDQVKQGSDAYDHGDYATASHLLEVPALMGNADAETIVGLMDWYGQGRPKNLPEAISLFRAASARNDPRAQNVLGFSYQHGIGVAIDLKEAVKFYKLAIQGGQRQAYFNLGLLTYWGAGVPKDVNEAQRLWTVAAGKGDYTAMSMLGILDAEKGTDDDIAKARALWMVAAAAGEPTALNGLGLLAQTGRGQPKDAQAAAKLFEASAAHGGTTGMESLGILLWTGSDGLPMDKSAAIAWWQKAAVQGNPTAAERMGEVYQGSGNAMTPDLDAAFEWYKRAGDEGLVIAMHNAGALKGIEHNFPESFKWHLLAAQNGDALSEASVGFLYMEGIGTQRDDVQAEHWLRAAIAAGVIDANTYLGVLLARGVSGSPPDYAAAFLCYRAAAEHGEPNGEENLSEAYIFGHGVQQSFSEALPWALKAAQQGTPQAMNDVGRMLSAGVGGVPKDMPQAIMWLRRSAEFGIPNAMHTLAGLYASDPGIPHDFAEADYWARLGLVYYAANDPKVPPLRRLALEIETHLSASQLDDMARRVAQFRPKPFPANIGGAPAEKPVEQSSQPSWFDPSMVPGGTLTASTFDR
jgi:hypothetical protein